MHREMLNNLIQAKSIPASLIEESNRKSFLHLIHGVKKYIKKHRRFYFKNLPNSGIRYTQRQRT